jgi:hypothetical protein
MYNIGCYEEGARGFYFSMLLKIWRLSEKVGEKKRAILSKRLN